MWACLLVIYIDFSLMFNASYLLEWSVEVESEFHKINRLSLTAPSVCLRGVVDVHTRHSSGPRREESVPVAWKPHCTRRNIYHHELGSRSSTINYQTGTAIYKLIILKYLLVLREGEKKFTSLQKLTLKGSGSTGRLKLTPFCIWI